MRSARTAAIAACVVLFAAASVPLARAHTEVKSTSPKQGSTAKTTIKRVTVTFTGTLRRGTLRVTRRGKVVSKGRGGRDPRSIKGLRVSLKSSLKSGSYKARWTIVAADGHEQKGSFSFKLKR